jgi:hypothetical protein
MMAYRDFIQHGMGFGRAGINPAPTKDRAVLFG